MRRGSAQGASLDPRFAEYQRTRDRNLRNELIEEYRWLAVHCARRFAHKGEPLDDLLQVAVVGVLKAVERFDPGYGAAFSTFAVPTIVGELRRHFRDRTWSVHVPRGAKETYQVVSGMIDELHQVLGRSPNVPEIAERAGVSVETALEALEVGGYYRGVPLTPANDEDLTECATLGQDDPGFHRAEARLTAQALLEKVPTKRERRILHMRFVEGMTQSEIAAEIGVSQVQISRLLRASLDKMRNALVDQTG